jgi:hypothetical protein
MVFNKENADEFITGMRECLAYLKEKEVIFDIFKIRNFLNKASKLI